MGHEVGRGWTMLGKLAKVLTAADAAVRFDWKVLTDAAAGFQRSELLPLALSSLCRHKPHSSA